MAGTVLVARAGPVVTVTLDRPEAMNALTRELLEALRVALEESSDPAVRCVVLTGAGAAFCAGQDLGELDEVAGVVRDALEETYHPVVRALRTLEKPVLAALNGPAAGAGLSLALACDVRVAAERAVLVPGFAGIGLVPDAGGSWAVTRLLGAGRAYEWMCSNRRLTAAEALAWGLVSEVVPEGEDFAAHVAELAARWAAGPTRALAATKRLVEHAHAATLAEQLALEAELQQSAVGTADFQEGIAAFREKRRPRFTGA